MTTPSFTCLLWLLIGYLMPLRLPGQVFQMDTVLTVPAEAGLHNVSGLEYIPTAGVWHLVGDRGEQWWLPELTRYDQAVRGFDTGLRLEALRYDALSRTYFGAVEDDREGNVTYGFFNPDSLPRAGLSRTSTVFNRLAPLPFDNKGIEGLALGPDSTLWVAPEAGWVPSDSGSATILFYRYRWDGLSLKQKTAFAYAPDRHPQLTGPDRYGGLSEILWAGPNRLLVLERFYDSGRDTVLAKLYEVTFQESRRTVAPTKTVVFDFNTQLHGHRVDNLEGMAWAPVRSTRRVLAVVSDDNGGRCPRPDGRQCQQTQFIFLNRSER